MKCSDCYEEILKLQKQLKDIKLEIKELQHPDCLYDEDGNPEYFLIEQRINGGNGKKWIRFLHIQI